MRRTPGLVKAHEMLGCILLEIEYRQALAVAAIAREYFANAQVVVHKDLALLERVVEIIA